MSLDAGLHPERHGRRCRGRRTIVHNGKQYVFFYGQPLPSWWSSAATATSRRRSRPSGRLGRFTHERRVQRPHLGQRHRRPSDRPELLPGFLQAAPGRQLRLDRQERRRRGAGGRDAVGAFAGPRGHLRARTTPEISTRLGLRRRAGRRGLRRRPDEGQHSPSAAWTCRAGRPSGAPEYDMAAAKTIVVGPHAGRRPWPLCRRRRPCARHARLRVEPRQAPRPGLLRPRRQAALELLRAGRTASRRTTSWPTTSSASSMSRAARTSWRAGSGTPTSSRTCSPRTACTSAACWMTPSSARRRPGTSRTRTTSRRRTASAYIVNGANDAYHIDRIIGLDHLHRFTGAITVTAADLQAAAAASAQAAAAPPPAPQPVIRVAWRPTPPAIDGDLGDWDMDGGVALSGQQGPLRAGRPGAGRGTPVPGLRRPWGQDWSTGAATGRPCSSPATATT